MCVCVKWIPIDPGTLDLPDPALNAYRHTPLIFSQLVGPGIDSPLLKRRKQTGELVPGDENSSPDTSATRPRTLGPSRGFWREESPDSEVPEAMSK